MPPLRTFVRQKADVNLKEEAEYMLVCSAYELKDRNAIAQLRNYLDTYPDTPHANRIYALIASAYFIRATMMKLSPCSTLPALICWATRNGMT